MNLTIQYFHRRILFIIELFNKVQCFGLFYKTIIKAMLIYGVESSEFNPS